MTEQLNQAPAPEQETITTEWDELSTVEFPEAGQPDIAETAPSEPDQDDTVEKEYDFADKAEDSYQYDKELENTVMTARAEHADDPNYPSVFWNGDNILQVTIGGQTEQLTPDEAINKYGDNADFMLEYKYLTQPTNVEAPEVLESPSLDSEDYSVQESSDELEQ